MNRITEEFNAVLCKRQPTENSLLILHFPLLISTEAVPSIFLSLYSCPNFSYFQCSNWPIFKIILISTVFFKQFMYNYDWIYLCMYVSTLICTHSLSYIYIKVGCSDWTRIESNQLITPMLTTSAFSLSLEITEKLPRDTNICANVLNFCKLCDEFVHGVENNNLLQLLSILHCNLKSKAPSYLRSVRRQFCSFSWNCATT